MMIISTTLTTEVLCFLIDSDTFKPRANLHAGMIRKPLEPYHPNAARSRLPSPTIVMPYKNSSQIVIGDRR
jgi:hypothetical protein